MLVQMQEDCSRGHHRKKTDVKNIFANHINLAYTCSCWCILKSIPSKRSECVVAIPVLSGCGRAKRVTNGRHKLQRAF